MDKDDEHIELLQNNRGYHYKNYKKVKQQNKRYQETLKFYADRKNWKGTVKGRSLYDDILDYGHTPIQIDEGMKAQRILEEYKNELE